MDAQRSGGGAWSLLNDVLDDKGEEMRALRKRNTELEASCAHFNQEPSSQRKMKSKHNETKPC